MQLCWLTCACSALNGEELTRSGGVGLLGELLLRCVAGGCLCLACMLIITRLPGGPLKAV